MLKKSAMVSEGQDFLLSSLSPGPAQKWLALAVVFGLLVVVFLIVGPFQHTQVSPLYAFVPAYSTAMFVSDVLTAVLLFSQFAILRSRAILVIANGYLYTALMLIPWILTFPGVFVPTGVIGGLQSTVWLYFFWHVGFPTFVIAYALSKDSDPGKRFSQDMVRGAMVLSIVMTAAAVSVIAFACIAAETLLPPVMLDFRHFGPLWPLVGVPVLLLSMLALILLWHRRRSMLDLWLMVVMCLYLVEILNYYPNPARYSLGWYAVRVIGFLSSILVLILLLFEVTNLYGRLLGAVLGQRREREARLMTGDAVAASIAHEVRQPLTAMITSADAGFRFLDRAAPNLDKAKAAFKLIAADGHRAAAVVGSIRAIFKKDVRTRILVDVAQLIGEALAITRSDLQKHGILVETDTNRQLPVVRGDRVQLQQVLLNLITNAIDAMAAMDDPRVLRVKSEIYEGNGVIVSVADTGLGISSQDINRIFNPLFTTKPDGMGMGLAICRSIIEAHDGRLWVAPNTPRGAVFQFTVHTS